MRNFRIPRFPKASCLVFNTLSLKMCHTSAYHHHSTDPLKSLFFQVVNEDEESSEDANKMPMADSAGFFLSLLMGLLGDMSKGSSGGHPWR